MKNYFRRMLRRYRARKNYHRTAKAYYAALDAWIADESGENFERTRVAGAAFRDALHELSEAIDG